MKTRPRTPVKFPKIVDRIVGECRKIDDSYNSDNIPIDHIRRINTWSRIASDSAKIVIFENADAMGESSRNSMLKLLEEPPENCYLILTTSRKGAVIPTILSRVRMFNFPERTKEESSEVIRRIFREEGSDYRNLREFFLGRKADTTLLRELSEKFVDALIDNSPGGKLSDIADFKPVFAGKRFFILFVQECIESIRERFMDGRIKNRGSSTA